MTLVADFLLQGGRAGLFASLERDDGLSPPNAILRGSSQQTSYAGGMAQYPGPPFPSQDNMVCYF